MDREQQEHLRIVGETIRRIRKERGLSQHQLAALCKNLDRTKLSRIENGLLSYEHIKLFDIAKALNVEVWVLVYTLPKTESNSSESEP